MVVSAVMEVVCCDIARKLSGWGQAWERENGDRSEQSAKTVTPRGALPYENIQRQMMMEATAPVASAIRPVARAWRPRRIPTAPK